MAEFLARLFLLLLPVALLLLAGLRLKRRVVFPHGYFPASRTRAADILLRSLRLRYDLILDALAALVVARALSGFPPPGPGRSAAVIDGSRSMLRGEAGARPLDRAVNALYAREDLEGARVFLLDFDPAGGTYRLRDFTAERRKDGREAFAARLGREAEALGSDWSLLSRLRSKGYGRIVVFTDSLPGEPAGFEAVETGFPERPYAYPASAGYEEASSAWALRLAVEGEPSGLIVHRWVESNATFVRLAGDRLDLSEGPSGWILRFPEPGLVLVAVGEDSFPVLLPPRPARPRGAGDFSRAMAAVFSFLPERPGEGLSFLDSDTGGRTGAVVTLRGRGDTPLLADPSEAYGGFVPLAAPRGGELALGRGSLDAPDLPLLYWHRVQAALPVPCFTDADEAGTGWKPQGTGFWRVTRSGPEALIPPAGEYSPIPKNGVIRIPEPSNPRWPTALALAIVYALKLALRRTFSGPESEGRGRGEAAGSPGLTPPRGTGPGRRP